MSPLEVSNAASIALRSDPDLVSYVEGQVAVATERLSKKDAEAIYERGLRTTRQAKKVNALMAVATTIVGSFGASATNNRSAWTGATVVLGAATAFVIGLRDDEERTRQIALCKAVVKSGQPKIDAYQSRWKLRIQLAPAAGTADRATFAQNLETETLTMLADVNQLLLDCK